MLVCCLNNYGRLQNNPYFCVFKYARTVKQKVRNEAAANHVANGLLKENRRPGNSTLFSEKFCEKMWDFVWAALFASQTEKKSGKVRDKKLDAESYCRPHHKAGQRKNGV